VSADVEGSRDVEGNVEGNVEMDRREEKSR
jgi:hypothetical protein